MQLFYIYVGGDMPGSLIEQHDVRFAVAENIEDTFDALRRSWWGRPKSLHIDCWGALTEADGHAISLRPEEPDSDDKLWFVNLGGYDPAEFTELHKNVLVVAPTESKAMVRALRQVEDWQGRHKDKIFEIENIYDVSGAARERSLHIHLEKIDRQTPFVFTQGFLRIGLPD